MKILIIGLGSMGKRRIRNLQSIGSVEIFCFDMQEHRRKESEEKYGIKTLNDIKKANLNSFDALVISTPPNHHNEYITLAIEARIPAFVEASVVMGNLEELKTKAEEKNVFIAPSCTMKFHPAVKKIKELVNGGKYGKTTNFIYHVGQYLPDWHPWENIKDFYVSKKETGGGREMVPFELTWLTDIFGLPQNVKGFFGKTIDLGIDIDDTYVFSMDFGGIYGSMLVDVVSRFATRSLSLNLEKAQILWRWDDEVIKIYNPNNKEWENESYVKGYAAQGYNSNITENMYMDEIKSFIDKISGRGKFPNSLEEDIKILKLLSAIEKDAPKNKN